MMIPDEERVEWAFDWDKLMQRLRDWGEGAYGHNPSLRELADAVGISAATLSRMDRGYTNDIKTLLDICSVIDAPPGEFFVRKVWIIKK
jgi:DNA-binding Xre family transcriptional regulator